MFQHIDTGLAARSLKNPPGGVETNRDSAVQIEVVGFAGSPKDVATLRTVAKLCRWLEGEHGISQKWPNGKPRASTTGKDPGGHNRNADTWDSAGGHYGHSQVPENNHWDPGYTAAELAIVTPEAVFDAHDELAVAASRAGAGIASDEPVAADSATIARRVLTGLQAAQWDVVGQSSRISVRVAAEGVEVEVVLERGGGSSGQAAPPSKRRPRSSRKKSVARRRR